MKRSVCDITLELQSAYSGTAVTVKRGDTHRTFRFHLTDGGRPYALGGDCTAVFTAVKPDGSHLYNACRVEDAILYDLTPQTTAVPGELECELRLYGKNGALLTAAAFVLTVEDTVYADGDENVASSGEATALTKLFDKVQEKINEMDAVLANEPNHAIIDNSKVGADAWSAKHIADMLCPAFTESGNVVTCAPLEGYPLQVVSTLGAKADGTAWDSITLIRCGKNLFDFNAGTYSVTYTPSSGEQSTRYGYAFRLPAGTYTLHAELVSSAGDYIYGYVNDAEGNCKGSCHLLQGINLWKQTVTVEDGDVIYIYNGMINDTKEKSDEMFARYKVQVEAGSVATTYEPYQGQTFTADISSLGMTEGTYQWSDVPALHGTNYLYTSCGNTAVSGREDPKALFEKLTNAILALGGNI